MNNVFEEELRRAANANADEQLQRQSRTAFVKPSEVVAITEAEPPARRSDALKYNHKQLLMLGRAVRKTGKRLILQFAAGKYVAHTVEYKTGRAAKDGQWLLLRDLRTATNNEQYNRLLTEFLSAARNIQIEQKTDDGTGESNA